MIMYKINSNIIKLMIHLYSLKYNKKIKKIIRKKTMSFKIDQNC